MREIKFRAWDKKEKKWIKEFTLQDLCRALISVGGDSFLPYDPLDLEFVEFTGLKDKNGVEIYEGDIVKWEQVRGDHIQEVKWDYMELSAMKMGTEDFGNIEVIGNIYENKELLR